jgi:hypothetical protein
VPGIEKNPKSPEEMIPRKRPRRKEFSDLKPKDLGTSSGSRAPRKTNVLRYEMAQESKDPVGEKKEKSQEEPSHDKIPYSDNFLQLQKKKHDAEKDLGYWWTGRTVFMQKDGQTVTVAHVKPRRTL